jgi:GT2 family glycosyltransferase
LDARWIEARVVVITDSHAATLDDCLDRLAEQCTPAVEVVVVDLDSSDGSADVAIRHPLVDRVFVLPPGDPDRVIEVASGDTRRLLLLRGDLRPSPGWLAAALGALEGSDLVLGPDRDPSNMGLDLWSLPPMQLLGGTTDVDEVLDRAHAAGARTATCDGMAVGPARATASRRGSLPVSAPPAPDAPKLPGTVTVVVCTRGRPTHLKRCLDSLSLLVDDDHEILIVDNNDVASIDGERIPPRGRVVHEPRRGLDVARNRGIAEAAGEVVAFIDDDCEADPHWLTALRVSFSDPSVGMVTGRVRPATLREPAQRWFESYFSFDRGTIRRRFTPWDRRQSYPLWTGGLGTGCNMAMRRSLLEDIGGFDELLDMGTSVGGGGDLDVYARLIDRGVIAEYAPDALVWHHHREDEAALRAQFSGYGASMGAYLMKAALDRPGQRSRALLYFAQRLAIRARVARDIRRGAHLLPMRLLVVDLRGALSGPFLYLRARWTARRR